MEDSSYQIFLIEIAGSVIGFVSFVVLMAIRFYEVEQKGPMVIKKKNEMPKPKQQETKKKSSDSDSDEEALIEK